MVLSSIREIRLVSMPDDTEWTLILGEKMQAYHQACKGLVASVRQNIAIYDPQSLYSYYLAQFIFFQMYFN